MQVPHIANDGVNDTIRQSEIARCISAVSFHKLHCGTNQPILVPCQSHSRESFHPDLHNPLPPHPLPGYQQLSKGGVSIVTCIGQWRQIVLITKVKER
jgi:hypothetical protein